jgi:hypothetical protein
VSSKPETPALPSDGSDADGETSEDKDPDKPASGGQDPSRTSQASTDQDDLNQPDPTEGELRKLRPETRRRFEVLLRQRNQARQSLEQVQPELTQHRQLRGYLEQNQLAPDDVNMLLGIGSSLRRGDYQAFLQGVTPYVQAAQEALGLRLPQDLRKQVDDGLLSDEAARELTRTRHRAAQAEYRLNEQTKVAETEASNRGRNLIIQDVDAWEADIRTRDPDYALKENAVRRYSQALIQERGMPQTREQGLALVKAAYDEATRELAKLRPQVRPTRTVPSGIHSSTNGSGAGRQPSTMKEAALMALANMRRAS